MVHCIYISMQRPIFDPLNPFLLRWTFWKVPSAVTFQRMNKNIKFGTGRLEFYTTLSQRVNAYFKAKQITRYANGDMVVKTICMLSMFILPYALSISGLVTSFVAYIGLMIIMGVGIAGIGLSIMHDANHGAYSKKPWINNFLGYSLNFMGATCFNWKIQHNVLHHTYTNIYEVDEDISPRGTLRMSPDSPWYPFHRFQHLYAWFLYCLMTLVWVVGKDFFRLMKYQKEGLIEQQKASAAREWLILITTKVLYVGLVFVLPVFVSGFTIVQVILGFLAMHFVAGFILAIVFQPAHVVEGTEYLMPDAEGNLENTWAIHQLHTTTNFAPNNRLLSWYVGGLNYQVEHHLFPNVCHVHYRAISEIVKSTAHEFGLPYKSKDTFAAAIIAHGHLLKQLGRPREHPSLVPA
jgi:linoleoyl-CoA desaturase